MIMHDATCSLVCVDLFGDLESTGVCLWCAVCRSSQLGIGQAQHFPGWNHGSISLAPPLGHQGREEGRTAVYNCKSFKMVMEILSHYRLVLVCPDFSGSLSKVVIYQKRKYTDTPIISYFLFVCLTPQSPERCNQFIGPCFVLHADGTLSLLPSCCSSKTEQMQVKVL